MEKRDIIQDWIDTHSIEFLNEETERLKKYKEDRILWPLIRALHIFFMKGNSRRLSIKKAEV